MGIDYKRVLIALARGAARRSKMAQDEAEIIGWATTEEGEHYPIHAATGGGGSEVKIYDPKTKSYSSAPKGAKIINKENRSYRINFVHELSRGGKIASADVYWAGKWHEVKNYKKLRELGEEAG